MSRKIRKHRQWTVKLMDGPMGRTVTVRAASAGAAILAAAEYVEGTAWTPTVAWPR